MDTDQELEKQEKNIKKSLLKVFLPIIAIIIPILYFQENDLDRVRQEYEKIRNEEYQGLVLKKKEAGDYPRAERYILLKDYRKIHISKDLFDIITAEDSVSKIEDCDSIYCYLKNGEIAIEDINEFRRDKYFNLLDKKKKE